MQGLIPAVALWRWRDAVFDGPFRRSLGRTKFAERSRDTALRVYPSLEQEAPIHLPHHFAEPNSEGPWGFTHRRSRAAIHLLSLILVCAFGEHRRSPALMP